MTKKHISLFVNTQNEDIEVDEDTPLLWVLRDHLGLTGTKFGCGAAMCGACTVHVSDHVDRQSHSIDLAIRSCVTPVKDVEGRHVTTIEGLALISENSNHKDREFYKRVFHVWETTNVPQCGYCQPGQIMSAVALLEQKNNPTDSDINTMMSGNLCRCGTYPRIRKAIDILSKPSVSGEVE